MNNESENIYEECPCCPDQGWVVEYTLYGEPEQIQCEFCYVNPKSKFNYYLQAEQLQNELDSYHKVSK